MILEITRYRLHKVNSVLRADIYSMTSIVKITLYSNETKRNEYYEVVMVNNVPGFLGKHGLLPSLIGAWLNGVVIVFGITGAEPAREMAGADVIGVNVIGLKLVRPCRHSYSFSQQEPKFCRQHYFTRLLAMEGLQ